MKTILSVTDWARLREVFDIAVDLENEQRAKFLDDACRDTPGLRTRVDSLLASIDAESSVFTEILSQAAADSLYSGLPVTGNFLGAYQVSGLIGRGGMGVVYRAVRADDEYQKEVAIKVATMGLLAPDFRQRFLAERQILANLDHPNIARLLDGGTTPEGVLYVVMELVEGQPIDAYCESAHLGLRERIQLMIVVAQSVEFAHRHLVVHRDLKPQNVLVTADGTPKLLDFGIAKALNPDASGAGQLAAITQDTSRLMTPEYASPEQVLGHLITTATDVYQLGILLYQLLTGRRPFQTTAADAFGDWEKRICETPVPRPGVDPDVDRILLKALEKDPHQRYTSAKGFADDLERYLGGFPVHARASSYRYRAAKFAKRHKFAVAAATLVLLLILSFSVGMAWLARRLEQQRNQARVQLQRSERVSQLLEEVFGGADPNSAANKNASARELLDRGTAAATKRLEKDPEVQAALYATLGHIYDNLGEIDQAENLMRQSLALRRKIYGERSVETAKGLNDEAEMLLDKGQYVRAEAMVREAVQIREALIGPESPEVAESLNFLGLALSYQGHRSEAEKLFGRSERLWEQTRGPQSPDLLEPLNNLSLMELERADYTSAEVNARRFLDISEHNFGTEAPQTTQAFLMLGQVLESAGNYREAEKLFRQSVRVRRKVLGPKHMWVGEAETQLAEVLRKSGHFEEAEKFALDAVRVEEDALGKGSPGFVAAIGELAQVYEERGEYAKAEPLFRSALATQIQLSGDQTSYVIDAKGLLAETLIHRGKLAETRELLDSALAVAKKDGGQSSTLAWIELDRGNLEAASGHPAQAEESYRKSCAILRAVMPAGNLAIADGLEALGSFLIGQGRKREAEPLLEEAFAIRRKTLDGSSPRLRATETLLNRAKS